MKSKKIIILYLCLVIFILIGLSITFRNSMIDSNKYLKYDKEVANTQLVYDSCIEEISSELCSNDYMSRAVGSQENINAANYIKEFFKKHKIHPLISNEYFNSIEMDVTTFNNNAQTKELNNVSAVIKGINSKNAIFVTAHFDHLSGLIGAIDNASGTSVMMEVAHKINEYTKDTPLDIDVVFIAFNAEEMGLIGSCDFLSKYSNLYDKYYNINIDCVGYTKSLELAMGNNHKESQKLYNSFKNSLKNSNIKYNDNIYASKDGVVRGSSDHQIFRRLGHPALVLGDDNLFDIVHTTDDTLDKVDLAYLNKLATVIADFIIQNNDNMFN